MGAEGAGERGLWPCRPRRGCALLAAAPDEWGAFVALCAFAGLRLGEAAALQVGDVDFLHRL